MVKLSRSQLTGRFVELTEQTYGRMHTGIPEESSELELTMPQMRTIFMLGQRQQRMSDIAAYLGSSLSSATSMIDRLVDKGLVERAHDPDDRRVVTCRLTSLGREAVERFWRIGRMRIEGVANLLTYEELETMVHAMGILSSAVARQAESNLAGSSAPTDDRPELT